MAASSVCNASQPNVPPKQIGDEESAHISCPNRKLSPISAQSNEHCAKKKSMAGCFTTFSTAIRLPIASGICTTCLAKRRWFYWLPAKGAPRKLVHRIESFNWITCRARSFVYSAQEELDKNLPKLLGRAKTIAMQYSPEQCDPVYFAGGRGHNRTDSQHEAEGRQLREPRAAIRSGLEPPSSTLRISKRETAWTGSPERHSSAPPKLVRDGVPFTEFDLQQWMLEQFRANGLIADSAPIVSVRPAQRRSALRTERRLPLRPIREGDLMLLDVWAKLDQPGSVYYDITWMGYLGAKVPKKYAKIFGVAKEGPRRRREFRHAKPCAPAARFKDGKWIASPAM